MTDFPFMEVDVEAAVQLATVQNGYDGEVQIIAVEPNVEKSYVLVKLDIVGQELTIKVRYMIFFPKPDDDDEKKNNKLLMIRNFFEAFDINGDARRDPMGWVGMAARALLKITTTEQWGDQNEVQKWFQK